MPQLPRMTRQERMREEQEAMQRQIDEEAIMAIEEAKRSKPPINLEVEEGCYCCSDVMKDFYDYFQTNPSSTTHIKEFLQTVCENRVYTFLKIFADGVLQDPNRRLFVVLTKTCPPEDGKNKVVKTYYFSNFGEEGTYYRIDAMDWPRLKSVTNQIDRKGWNCPIHNNYHRFEVFEKAHLNPLDTSVSVAHLDISNRGTNHGREGKHA